MALFAKLLKLQQAVVGLTKDSTGDKYNYVSGDKILSVVRPTMDEIGLILVPEVLNSTFTRQDYSTRNGQKSEMFCALQMRFTWVDAETGENLPCLWASSGMNNWDKSLGSAITYGERYFLLKFFHIATDKDDVDAPKTIEEKINDQNWEAYFNSLATIEELDAAWNQYGPSLKGNKAVIKAFNKRKQEVANGVKLQ